MFQDADRAHAPDGRSTWDRTYRRTPLTGLPNFEVVSAVSDDTGLLNRLEYCAHLAPGSVRIGLDITPATMRALAALLETEAARIERELLPLLAPPRIAPLVTLPDPLYAEPEAA